MNVTTERNSSRRSHNHRRVQQVPAENTSGSRQAGRRRRSRSPEGQGSQHQGQANAAPKPDTSQNDSNKRKKSNNPSLISTSSRPFIVAIDEVTSDRGRKSKSKPRSHNRHLTENATSSTLAHTSDLATVKRERSKSRESSKIPSKTTSDVDSSAKDLRNFLDAQTDYSGPLAVAEYSRMKREYDNWRKLAHENKKTIKRQSKLLDELKQQENTLRQKLKESESQMQKLQKKSDEIINTVESNTQCQICMELLFKPYALSPCGHVLCVGCLQEWFRKAPAGDDDMYDDNDPDYLVRRRKTCPCCRTHVRHRPIPIFMIKAIAAVIGKAKGNSPAAYSPSRDPVGDSDPWEGLFPTDDEDISDYGESDEDDEDDEDEDEDEDNEYEEEDEDSGWYEDVFSYGTDSDEEPYEGNYVHPQWAPPTVVIDEEDYVFEQLDDNDLNVLRRGATLGMLQLYDMQYAHEEGLVAHDEANNRIYLGWNVRLSADDDTGEAYMRYLAEEMDARPEKWSIIFDDDGGFEAHLLVQEDDVYDYRDTDSENYMDLDDLD
ncbi:hypothetical protein F5I97DRAFT_1875210 [Phlebopus sp. FC_14]|nr:hypothetical protein F5I97DRAFT_1875210 [Phlebopus sp. FC_14]